MELFLSTYVNKVDRKGRVSVPATLRSTLAKDSQPNLLVGYPSLRVDAVECAGSDRMGDMQRRIDMLEQFSDEYENLTQIFADSHQMSMDPEGRIVLHERLKEYAGIGDEVAFVGLGATFQLWDPGRYEDYRAAVRERSRRQGTTLPPRGGAARRPPSGDA